MEELQLATEHDFKGDCISFDCHPHDLAKTRPKNDNQLFEV